jgi:hypothetical protein
MRQMRAKNTRKFDLCKKNCKFSDRAKNMRFAKNTRKSLRISIFAEFPLIFALREKIRICTKCSKICKYLLSTQKIYNIHEKFSMLKSICPAKISNTQGLIISHFNVMSCQNLAILKDYVR